MTKSVQEGADSFRIRQELPEDLLRIREIEDESGSRFSGLCVIDESLDEAFPIRKLAHLISLRQV